MIEPLIASDWYTLRAGERRLGQHLACYSPEQSVKQTLQVWHNQGIRFVLFGVPEDLGPRANLGRGGADGAWPALLSWLLNLQWHDDPVNNSGMEQLALLGSVPVADLQRRAEQASVSELRQLVAELDRRVEPVAEAVIGAGLIPVVVGGGHNNALPVMRAWRAVHGSPLPVVNLDPHADTRALEGRHSGNPFHYALHEGALTRYAVVGCDPLKNSAETLSVLARHQCQHYRSLSELQSALGWLAEPGQPLGVELDLDAIAHMPSSASSPWGVSLSQAQAYLAAVLRRHQPGWVHLAEGAPACHPAGPGAGEREVGQSLAGLVAAVAGG